MLHVTFSAGVDDTTCTVLPEGVTKISAPYMGLCASTEDIKHNHIPCGMNTFVTSENKHCFVEAQRRHRVALYECLKSRMYDVIAQSAADAESLSEAPVYVLLRDSAASEWTARVVKDIWL